MMAPDLMLSWQMSTSPSAKHPATAAGTIALGELTVNRLGYGAMRLTGRGVFGPPEDRDNAIRVLRYAVELGVNFIDTADSYGPYVSEELIADALYPYPEGLVIATKGGFERPAPSQWIENGRPEHLRAALEGSLRRLKLERIDLWQLHRIDRRVPADEQFGVLAEFVREGKVRHVGLSEVSIEDIEQARSTVPIISVQNRYNLVNRRWDDVVDFCDREGIAFIPWYPLGSGSLEKEAGGRHTPVGLESIARRLQATPLQVAIAWLLARSPACLPIPGTSKPEHLEENVRAAELRLSDDDLHDLENSGME
jgi:aryl-alcohol dehydrogenase-like predicted oxidoreductase